MGTRTEETFVTYRNPKLLIYDIESAPFAGTMYEAWQANAVDILEPKYLFCFAYAWFDFDNPDKPPKVKAVSLVDTPARFLNNPFDDYDVAVALNRLLLEADWQAAFNGRRFDIKMANTRFVKHKLPFIDPIHTKMIDPFRTVKSNLLLERNNLDYVSKYLGNEGKLSVTHADVRLECSQIKNWWKHEPVKINKKAWKQMVEYCKQDVIALYEDYRDTRHFDRTHPNVGIFKGIPCCPKCGGERLHIERIRPNNTMVYRQYICDKCGARPRERLADKDIQVKPDFVN